MTLLDRPEGRLAVALGIGLVIGAERERRKNVPGKRVFAGIRTFALVALLGGVVVLLGGGLLLVAGCVAVAALAVVVHLLGDRRDPGITTEVALLLTFCLGALALREPKLALACGLSAATLLAFRTPLHHVVRSALTEEEVRDALLLGVAALVVLPLLPREPIDPIGVLNLFTLWRLVVVLLALSGLGYAAQRLLGPRYGLALAGLGSGFVSSSMTIASMGARVRADGEVLRPAVAGAAASTVSTFVLLSILVGTADVRLLLSLAAPLGAGGLTALAYAGYATWRGRLAKAEPTRGRAFRFAPALAFALIVTGVAFVSTLARRALGDVAAIGAAAVAALADVHAAASAVASIAALGHISPLVAQLGVLVALSTNTITKAVLAFVSGPRAFSLRVVAGLALTLVAAWATMVALLVLRR